MTIGTLAQCSGNMLVVMTTDFELESTLAQQRRIAQNSGGHHHRIDSGSGTLLDASSSTQLRSSPLFEIIDEDDEDEDEFGEVNPFANHPSTHQ
jgi:hypothetical protein